MVGPRTESSRHLDWAGCFNVRDLGGLLTTHGRRTRRGAVFRADNLERLTAPGWSALVRHGVRTVIDLRNDDEVGDDVATRPSDVVRTVRVPLDDVADTSFWEQVRANDLDGSPLYFPVFMERKPHRCAAAVAAFAAAPPGGVVVHCGAGRDRTGLVTLLLLAVAGVGADEIAADYDLSTARLEPAWSQLGLPDQGEQIREVLRRRQTTARVLIRELLDSYDVPVYLRRAGVSDAQLDAVRSRLLGPPAS